MNHVMLNQLPTGNPMLNQTTNHLNAMPPTNLKQQQQQQQHLQQQQMQLHQQQQQQQQQQLHPKNINAMSPLISPNNHHPHPHMHHNHHAVAHHHMNNSNGHILNDTSNIIHQNMQVAHISSMNSSTPMNATGIAATANANLVANGHANTTSLNNSNVLINQINYLINLPLSKEEEEILVDYDW